LNGDRQKAPGWNRNLNNINCKKNCENKFYFVLAMWTRSKEADGIRIHLVLWIRIRIQIRILIQEVKRSIKKKKCQNSHCLKGWIGLEVSPRA
jgi:hypothetical protein